MKVKAKWLKKLTAAERNHLFNEANVRTLWQFKETHAQHEEWRKNGGNEPCFTCKAIARKLGMECN